MTTLTTLLSTAETKLSVVLQRCDEFIERPLHANETEAMKLREAIEEYFSVTRFPIVASHRAAAVATTAEFDQVKKANEAQREGNVPREAFPQFQPGGE